YVLGGPVLTLKQIKAKTEASNYRGYLENEIRAVDKQPEPRRSELLRHYREEFRSELAENVSRYRTYVRDVRRYRAEHQNGSEPFECEDVHTSMSLAFAHLTNDFAHLAFLDELLSKQSDLFDL
ncbi:MAG: hypothetical protein AAGK33_15195, partial [Pseudomonadota bacterium]